MLYGTVSAVVELLTTALRVMGSIPPRIKYLYGLQVDEVSLFVCVYFVCL